MPLQERVFQLAVVLAVRASMPLVYKFAAGLVSNRPNLMTSVDTCLGRTSPHPHDPCIERRCMTAVTSANVDNAAKEL